MLFNSGVFFQFLAAFLLLYWLARNHLDARNLLIVVASYFFYGWWDWRFLSLLFFSSAFDFLVGIGLGRTQSVRGRRLLVAGSILVNLTILGFFKYWNFFADSMAVLLSGLGFKPNVPSLSIILPVGISFYTFQSMSYAIDVYRGHITPTRQFIRFLAYVAFFPQLVAGPIERARHLLPQFSRCLLITREMIEEGIWLILWGLFKKVVVADHCAALVDMVFEDTTWSALDVLLGTAAFGFQVYGDFSGYSDIARGVARILGFDIMVNFQLPYFATGLRDFWRRWHISFSTWIRDYVYIPIGGNRLGPGRTAANLMLTMTLAGLWHGAAWNFVLWGLWHGLGLSLEHLGSSKRPADDPPRFRWGSWAVTLLFVFYGWLLFRAKSSDQIAAMTLALGHWFVPFRLQSYLIVLLAWTTPLVAMEIWQFKTRNRLQPLAISPVFKTLLQGLILIAILVSWESDKVPFIYFQF